MRASIGVGCLWVGLSGAACKSPPTQRPTATARDSGPARAPAPAIADGGGGPADPDGSTPNPGCFPRGEEGTAAACGNRLDDDCDGQIDCADNECAQAPGNPCRGAGAPREAPAGTGDCLPRGEENNAAACGNRLDDDCDGQIDCVDHGCLFVPRTPCGTPDGAIPSACVPRGLENTDPACGNRLDDDCDGQIDCADNECTQAPATVCGRRDAQVPPPPGDVPTRR